MAGIFFDIDDTLYGRQDLLLKAAAETLAWAAGERPEERTGADLVLDRKEFVRIFYLKSDENFNLVESGRITARESNVWRLQQTFQTMGLPCPEGAGDVFADRYTYLQDHISLPPVLFSMMEKLQDGHVPVGILTNGASDHQWKKVRMLGLDRWIPDRYVIVSGDAGVSKPDPEIFRAAEKAMGQRPQDLWLAGDSLRHDILGARKAGWHALWLDRRHAGSQEHSDGKNVEEAADRTADSEENLAKAVLNLFSL